MIAVWGGEGSLSSLLVREWEQGRVYMQMLDIINLLVYLCSHVFMCVYKCMWACVAFVSLSLNILNGFLHEFFPWDRHNHWAYLVYILCHWVLGPNKDCINVSHPTRLVTTLTLLGAYPSFPCIFSLCHFMPLFQHLAINCRSGKYFYDIYWEESSNFAFNYCFHISVMSFHRCSSMIFRRLCHGYHRYMDSAEVCGLQLYLQHCPLLISCSGSPDSKDKNRIFCSIKKRLNLLECCLV